MVGEIGAGPGRFIAVTGWLAWIGAMLAIALGLGYVLWAVATVGLILLSGAMLVLRRELAAPVAGLTFLTLAAALAAFLLA